MEQDFRSHSDAVQYLKEFVTSHEMCHREERSSIEGQYFSKLLHRHLMYDTISYYIILLIQVKQTEIAYVGSVELNLATFSCPELLNALKKRGLRTMSGI